MNNKNVDYFNNETVRILLKYNIVTREYIDKLEASGKININI